MRRHYKKSENNSLRKTAIGFVIAVLVFFVLQVFILPPIVRHKLNKTHFSSYSIDVKKVSINLITNKFVVDSLSLQDSLNSTHFFAADITLRGINIYQLLFKHHFSAKSIVINKPIAAITIGNDDMKANVAEDSSKKKWTVSIDKLAVVDAQSEINNHDEVSQLVDIDLECQNISTLESKAFTFQNVSFDRILISIGKGSTPFSDGLYTFEAQNFSYDSSNEPLIINEINLISNNPKYEIAHKTGVQTDWISFNIQAFKTYGFNLHALLEKKSFIADYISLNQVNGAVFRDKRLPFPKKPDTKLPMQMIDSLSFNLHIDSISIMNTHIKYEEHVAEASNPGYVEFKDLQANIFELSNIAERIQKPTSMHVHSRFMGEPLLNIDFEMPNIKFPKPYSVVGTLEPSSFTIFNPMLEESYSASIKSGNIDKFKFNFAYNEDVSNGILYMEYSDLEVDVLRKDDDSKSNFKSLVINSLVIQKKNINKNHSQQQGEISFERDKKRSIFNYWWNSLFSGIKNVVIKL